MGCHRAYRRSVEVECFVAHAGRAVHALVFEGHASRVSPLRSARSSGFGLADLGGRSNSQMPALPGLGLDDLGGRSNSQKKKLPGLGLYDLGGRSNSQKK